MVQRTASLYTRDNQAIRVEVHEGPGVLRLIVLGPGDKCRTVDFTGEKPLTEYQSIYECALLDAGFQLQAVAERRGRGGRPPRPHMGPNRRR